jgi:hypothetical protein
MSLVALIFGGLITWRLSYMLVNESGPLLIFDRLRAWAAKYQTKGGLFDLLSCVYCTSMWIGAVSSLFVARSVSEFIVYTLSFSAVSSFIERLTTSQA